MTTTTRRKVRSRHIYKHGNANWRPTRGSNLANIVACTQWSVHNGMCFSHQTTTRRRHVTTGMGFQRWVVTMWMIRFLSTPIQRRTNIGRQVAIPLQALDWPLGLHEVRVPRISRQSVLEGGMVVSHMHRLLSPPRKYSWYSFLLEAELTPGP